jgi:uncharacterized protein YecT (DUF1311 family)
MKLIACMFTLLTIAVSGRMGAQTNSADDSTARSQRNHELHANSLGVVEAEQARAKQPLCPKAVTTIDVNSCFADELGITDGNYLKLAGNLRALLRGDEAKGKDASTPTPFDDAETRWHSYRDRACDVAGDQYIGGTIRPSVVMRCRLVITRHHIDELWAVYSDFGMH